MSGFLERRILRRSVQKWTDLAERAPNLSAEDLVALNSTAQRLRRRLDRLTVAAETALVPDPQGGIRRPDQCDWAWRPDPWCVPSGDLGIVAAPSPCNLSEHVTLFHDCAQSEICLRQFRNALPGAASGYGNQIDVYRFDGSFLSLVLTLPDGAFRRISRNHFFTLRSEMTRENPIEVYARLNVQHGPNTEQIVRQLEFNDDRGLAEFDLAYSNINEKRVEKIWIDLIFDNPAMNQVTLHDLTLTRAPRADL
jgi:Family of unknown function (DUF6478)